MDISGCHFQVQALETSQEILVHSALLTTYLTLAIQVYVCQSIQCQIDIGVVLIMNKVVGVDVIVPQNLVQ